MTLHVKQPRPSIYDSVGLVRGRQGAADREDELRQRRIAGSQSREKETTDRDYDTGGLVEKPLQSACFFRYVCARVSTPFTTRQISPNALSALQAVCHVLAHAHVQQTDAQGRPRRRRLRFHLFESLVRKRHHHPDSLPAGSTTNAGENQTSPAAVDPPYAADAPRE